MVIDEAGDGMDDYDMNGMDDITQPNINLISSSNGQLNRKSNRKCNGRKKESKGRLKPANMCFYLVNSWFFNRIVVCCGVLFYK